MSSERRHRQRHIIIHTFIYLLYITGSAVATALLTATGLGNGEWKILTPYTIESPKPIDKKFCTRDYVGETTPYAKFGANRSTGGFWANR